jgi:hypothetical protein
VIPRQHLPRWNRLVFLVVLVAGANGDAAHASHRREIDAVDAPRQADVQSLLRLGFEDAAKAANYRAFVRLHLRERGGDGPDGEGQGDQDHEHAQHYFPPFCLGVSAFEPGGWNIERNIG